MVRSNRTVWAWGANERGQWGNGSQYELYTPQQVTGGCGGTTLAAGNLHLLLVRSDGRGLAWGLNKDGQLGSGQPVYITC